MGDWYFMGIRKRAVAISVAVLAFALIPTAASAAYRSATTADGYAWGSIETDGKIATVTVNDSGADGRGPTIYYKLGSNDWMSTPNPKGAGGQVVHTPSVYVKSGTKISFYVCNANTKTGYRSCSVTITFNA